jgi:predicted lipoprotein with Yx(FWY)xxD motif
MRKTPIVAAALVAAVAAASAAGAGGGAVVKTRSTGLGRILVDAKGRSLYLWEADRHGKSTCYGACAKFWPPLLTGARPRAGAGVKASLLGTVKRQDGRLQVTYRGHPLYLFVKDARAGQVNGEGSTGFGAAWYVLAPSGATIDKQTSSASSPSAGSTTTPATTTPGYGGADPAPGGGYGY